MSNTITDLASWCREWFMRGSSSNEKPSNVGGWTSLANQIIQRFGAAPPPMDNPFRIAVDRLTAHPDGPHVSCPHCQRALEECRRRDPTPEQVSLRECGHCMGVVKDVAGTARCSLCGSQQNWRDLPPTVAVVECAHFLRVRDCDQCLICGAV